MATDQGSVKTAPVARHDTFIAGQLTRAERRIRGLDLATAILGFIAGTCVYAGLMVILDRTLVQAETVRQLLFLGYFAAAAAYIYYFVAQPLTQRINPYFAARRVEQTLPGVKNSVVNWVDLRDQSLPPAIRTALSSRAAKDLSRADIEQAVSGRNASIAGGVTALAVGILFVLLLSVGSESFVGGLGRAFFPFRSSAPAARTRLTLLRPVGGDTSISVGHAVAIAVEVEGKRPDPKGPEAVRLLYRYQEAAPWLERSMNEDEPREFAVTVPSTEVQSGFWYKVVGGDSETAEYRVTVRSTPQLTDFQATYHFPKYAMIPQETRRERDLRAVEGTEVVLWGLTNRSIREAHLDFDGKAGRQKVAGDIVGEGHAFQVRFPITETGLYRLVFTSIDGDVFTEPFHAVEALRDRAPEVQLTKPGQDVALPANGLLMVEGRAADDFGVREMVLRLKVNDVVLKSKPYRSPDALRLPGGGYPLTVTYKDAIDLGKVEAEEVPAFHLSSGTELEYWLEAADAHEPTPNVGASKHFRVQLTQPEKNEAKQQQDREQAKKEQQKHEQGQDQQLKNEAEARQEKSKESEKKEQQPGQGKNQKDNQPGNGQSDQANTQEDPKNGQGDGNQSEKGTKGTAKQDKQNDQDKENPGAPNDNNNQPADKQNGDGKDNRDQKDATNGQPGDKQNNGKDGQDKDKQGQQKNEGTNPDDKQNAPGNEKQEKQDGSQDKPGDKQNGHGDDKQGKQSGDGNQSNDQKNNPGKDNKDSNAGKSGDKQGNGKDGDGKDQGAGADSGQPDKQNGRNADKNNSAGKQGDQPQNANGGSEQPDPNQAKRDAENRAKADRLKQALNQRPNGENKPDGKSGKNSDGQNTPKEGNQPDPSQNKDKSGKPETKKDGDKKPQGKTGDKQTGDGKEGDQNARQPGEGSENGNEHSDPKNGGKPSDKANGSDNKKPGDKSSGEPKPQAGKDGSEKSAETPGDKNATKPQPSTDGSKDPSGQPATDKSAGQQGTKNDPSEGAGKESPTTDGKKDGMKKETPTGSGGDKKPEEKGIGSAPKNGTKDKSGDGTGDPKLDPKAGKQPGDEKPSGADNGSGQKEPTGPDKTNAGKSATGDKPQKSDAPMEKSGGAENAGVEDARQAAKDLQSADPKKRAAAADKLKQMSQHAKDPTAREQAKKELEKDAGDPKSADGNDRTDKDPGDANKDSQTTGSGTDQTKKDASGGPKPDGRGKEPNKDGANTGLSKDKGGEKTNDMKDKPGSGDPKPNEGGEGQKQTNAKGTKPERKPGDPEKIDKPDPRENNKDKNGEPTSSEMPGTGGQGPHRGVEDGTPRQDPGPAAAPQKGRQFGRNTELQLEDLDKVTKKELDAAKLTEQDLAALRDWLKTRKNTTDAKEVSVAPQRGGPAGAMGGKRVQPGTAGKANDLSGGSRSLPPPGYREANDAFKRLINKPEADSP